MSLRRILSVSVVLLQVFVDQVDALPKRRMQELTPEDFFRELSPMFPKLSFAEQKCSSSAGRFGQCVGYPDCEGPPFVREGSCSDGFGVCCVYALSGSSARSSSSLSPSNAWPQAAALTTALRSGGVQHLDVIVPESRIRFTNPGYPSKDVQPHWSADAMVPSDVCQVRIDFELLDLPRSVTFKVKLNGVIVVPTLTGNNTGQHFIVSMATTNIRPARFELSVTGPPLPTSWSVRLLYSPCFSSALAPDGCAQYHTRSSGRVRSLSVASTDPTPYAVCLLAPRPTVNLITLETMPDRSDYSCRSFMQVPAGMGLDGKVIPTKVCPHDEIKLKYKVFGPLVLYMITTSGHRGINVQYDL
ncbi:hypothetical protein BIW11_11807 [Tropilaelaps mercedesae]|uniref:CUB domain-containing protein n=1 Tax=Tropilaelaps mercedesae TaxID=418985 RepID=A0A1V9X9D6_9ACAR|nr:hypothetical protein BIW11_11807 [Tropilaelaps mercedesae]